MEFTQELEDLLETYFAQIDHCFNRLDVRGRGSAAPLGAPADVAARAFSLYVQFRC